MIRFVRFYRAARCLCALALVLAAAACTGKPTERGVPEEVVRANVLGTAYLGQQKWAEAEQAFRDALELRPEHPLLLNNAAVAAIQQGRIDEAERLLEQAIAVDAEYPYARYNLGLIAKNRGDFEQAAEHFEAVRRFDPDDLMTHYNLGIVYSRTGRGEDAERAYRQALALDPTHVSSLYGLGRFLLQRGDQEEGVALISQSQQIRARSGLDEAVGSQYGEQGPYAMGADFPGDALAAPDPIPVRFRPVARADLNPALSPPRPAPQRWTLGRQAPGGAPAIFFADGGALQGFDLGGLGQPIVTPAREELLIDVAAGDVDNDGAIELVALMADPTGGTYPVLLRAGDAGFERSGPASGNAVNIANHPASIDLTLVDHDHDGDLDLFACWAAPAGGGCALGTNDGQGVFEMRRSADHGFEPVAMTRGPVRVGFSDIDNDRDVDLLVARWGRADLFTNQRDGTFEPASDAAGLGSEVGDATGTMVVADVNKDGWMDLLLGVAEGTRIFRNHLGGFEPSHLFESETGPGEQVVLFDYDNDGFLDLARGGRDGFHLHRNLGAGEWAAEKIALDSAGSSVLTDEPPATVSPVAAFDPDEDGDLDLVVSHEYEPSVVLLSNEGGNANRWISVASRGTADNRNGIGAKVEFLAGALRQKFEITHPLPLHAGLGNRESVESVRYLWPSGILQDEINLQAGAPIEVVQLDRKGTSCPLLYAWRDGAWRFVTDFLGGCAIGYRHGPDRLSVPDTDEYVKIEGGITAEPDGTLRLRINNQLQEVIWFDQTELVVVDHPAGSEVFPNERLMPGPPWPEFALYVSRDVRPIAGARGVEDGADLSAILAARDRRYVRNFELLPFKGYAEPHTVELDLGRFDNAERVVLLLDGWIDYADSSANVAAGQAGLRLMPPRLTVADGGGGWLGTGHLMGFPAGLPKTMAVELTGLFPSADHRVRIATNMRIYWDRARLLVGGRDLPTRVERLRPLGARLRFGGFPEETSPDGRAPFAYAPESVAARSPWGAHVGRYTAFGEVGRLLLELDDRFVTTRSGDEMELRFPPAGPLQEGWSRTYLLYADGFGKDMDPNSAANAEVGPIPFHGMPVYPYGDDVTPPVTPEGGRPARSVLESGRGWHGAHPQPLVPRPPSPDASR